MHKLNKAEYNARKAEKEAARVVKNEAKTKPNNAASLKERLDAIEIILGL